MSKIVLDITTDNAAFEGDDYFFEVARILRELAAKVESQQIGTDDGCGIKDSNGNTVGYFRHTSGE